MKGETRHQLHMELRHLQSRLSLSALGAALSAVEGAFGSARQTALHSGLLLRIGAEALAEDLPRARAWLHEARRALRRVAQRDRL